MSRIARQELVDGVQTEYRDFAEFLRTLDDEQWAVPTRCDGWVVADAAAHVAGQIDDVTNLRFDALGSPDAVARQVADRKGRTPAELADEIAAAATIAGELLTAFDDESWDAPAPGGFGGTTGDGVHGLWYDTWVHRDDIHDALGIETDRGPGLRAAALRSIAIIERDDRAGIELALDGVEEVVIGSGETRVEGDPYDFVMVATGRADASALGLPATVNVYG